MVVLDLKVLVTLLMKIVENVKYQKDAQRNSVQKEVLNSSPSFFSASLVKKTLIRFTSQDRSFANWLGWVGDPPKLSTKVLAGVGRRPLQNFSQKFPLVLAGVGKRP